MLGVSGKAETGSTGEQPVRNIPTDWNKRELVKYINSGFKLFRSDMH